MKNKIYGCDSIDCVLPTNIKFWLQKYKFSNLIAVPIRQNGLTGSGYAQQCHSNVMNLVAIYGGMRLGGFGIDEIIDSEGESYLQFFAHSVWLTPEGNAVDVTARNYSNKEFQMFIPMKTEKLWTQHLVNFCLPRNILKNGIYLNFHSNKETINTANELNMSYKELSDGTIYLRMPASKFNKLFLFTEYVYINKDDIKSDFKNGGFYNQSSCTNKSWDAIKAEKFRI
jgi:hypothetical protein